MGCLVCEMHIDGRKYTVYYGGNIFVNDNTIAYIYVLENAPGEMETPKAHRVSTSVYT